MKDATKQFVAVTSSPKGSRLLENIGFAAALLLGFAYVALVEILPATCRALGKCEASGDGFSIPIGLLIVMTIFAAPKMLGRATAGKMWEAIASRIRGKEEASS